MDKIKSWIYQTQDRNDPYKNLLDLRRLCSSESFKQAQRLVDELDLKWLSQRYIFEQIRRKAKPNSNSNETFLKAISPEDIIVSKVIKDDDKIVQDVLKSLSSFIVVKSDGTKEICESRSNKRGGKKRKTGPYRRFSSPKRKIKKSKPPVRRSERIWTPKIATRCKKLIKNLIFRQSSKFETTPTKNLIPQFDQAVAVSKSQQQQVSTLSKFEQSETVSTFKKPTMVSKFGQPATVTNVEQMYPVENLIKMASDQNRTSLSPSKYIRTKCQICSLPVVNQTWNQTRHALKHLGEKTRVSWLYKCLLCLQNGKEYTTVYRDAMWKHIQLAKNGNHKIKLVQPGIHYVDHSVEFANEIKFVKILAFPP